ncbi:MAG: hypothetical protein WEA77_00745 [Hyphomonas sp.]|uniref:DUF1579 domain-containing protein n=1 Tax=Hyphomonas sp. TaxID=87 RepID=UPI0034A050FD
MTSGNLSAPSASSNRGLGCPRDFGFQIGRWRVTHKRLRVRLAGPEDWETFSGTSVTRPVLGGAGNIEDNVLDISSGTCRVIAIRSCDTAAKSWAIWWLDDRSPSALDVPVIASFADGVGKFLAVDTSGDTPVHVCFLWLRTDTSAPRWEQAKSVDGGETGETNRTMDFERDEEAPCLQV